MKSEEEIRNLLLQIKCRRDLWNIKMHELKGEIQMLMWVLDEEEKE